MLIWGGSCFSKIIITHGSPEITHGSPEITHGSPEITHQGVIFEYLGVVVGNDTFEENPKKCEDENDADGLKTYFAIDFGIIFGNFRAVSKKMEGGEVFESFFYIRNSRSTAPGGQYVPPCRGRWHNKHVGSSKVSAASHL